MKYYPILRRVLCGSLSIAMLMSSQIVGYATGTDGGGHEREIASGTEAGTKNSNSEEKSTNLNETQTKSEEENSNKKTIQEEVKKENKETKKADVDEAESESKSEAKSESKSQKETDVDEDAEDADPLGLKEMKLLSVDKNTSVYTVAGDGNSYYRIGYINWAWATKVWYGDNEHKYGNWQEEKHTATADVCIVDENGQPIVTKETIKEKKLDTSGEAGRNLSGNEYGFGEDYFKSFAPHITGYTYVGTYTSANYKDSEAIWNISYNPKDEKASNYWYAIKKDGKGWDNLLEKPSKDNSTKVYMVYSSSPESDDVEYVYGNLFDYEKDYVNQKTMESSDSKNGALKFTTGGQSGDKWNDCDTDGLGYGTQTAFQGIVGDRLENNLPAFNYAFANVFDPDDELFAYNPGDFTATLEDDTVAYRGVKIPFYKEDGYYVLDSTINNSYTYKRDEAKIELSKSSDYNKGFWPLGTENKHFGMDFQTYFNINENPDGTVFEFAGDDDVWVYIDGRLALDMGGIHQTVEGSIDFNTGECVVNYAYNEKKDIDRAQETHNLYTDVLGYGDVESGKKALVAGTHTLSFFYLERGAMASNCKVKYNFNVKPEPEPQPEEVISTYNVEARYSKTANVADWNNRIYDINLFADVTGVKYVPKQETVPAPVDVMLVVDATYSMYFPGDLQEVDRGTSALVPGNTYYFIGDGDRCTCYEVTYNYQNNRWEYVDSSSAKAKNQYGGPGEKNELIVETTRSWWNTEYKYRYGKSTRNTTGYEVGTFYTSPSGGKVTRLSSLQRQMTEFVQTVGDINERSRIGIVFFNTAAGQLAPLTKLDDAGIEKLTKIINGERNDSTSLANKIGSGTSQDKGLAQVVNSFDSSSSHSKYTVLVSDGCPTVSAIDVINSLTDSVNNLRNQQVTCMSIGLDVETNQQHTTTVDKVLLSATSAAQYYYTSTSAELYETFKKVTETITNYYIVTTKKAGTVVDYIDSRFELVGEPSLYGGDGIYDDAGNLIGVKWEVDELNSWMKTIQLQAKADFMGGNVITTNTPASGLTVDDTFYKFEEPTVNVKLLDFELVGDETTILLYDSYSQVEAINELLNSLTSSDMGVLANIIKEHITAETLLNGGTFSIPYAYVNTTDNVGTIQVRLIKENHAKEAPSVENLVKANHLGDDAYVYRLIVSYKAKSYDERVPEIVTGDVTSPDSNDMAKGYYLTKDYSPELDNVDSRTAEAVYKVNVVDAYMYFDKIGGKVKRTKLAGAEYLVSTSEDFTTSYRVLSSSDENGVYSAMLIDGMGVGTYYLKETKAPAGYGLSDEVFTIEIKPIEGQRSSYVLTVNSSNNRSEIDTVTNEFSVLNNTDNSSVLIGEEVLFQAVDIIAYTLPETGGRGFYLYTISGVLLMIGATLLLYKNKKILK
ncbi:MAG: fibro-slime domain-containing protein [Pseudobutyrivibrio sp.]|nr:fibro-slime domain-containing protein [Pseudobutyrivibrio sp.]